MNYSDLVAAVYTLTNRPDLVNETATAIKAATLRAHHSDFYYKDIVEVAANFTNLTYLQQIPLGFFSSFRALKYIRKYYPGATINNPPPQDQNPNNFPPLFGSYYTPGANLPDGRFFEIITPEEVLNSYGVNKIDVAYLAGQTIQIRSGDAFQYVLCGYYQHPNVTPDGYSSWVANENPYAIIYAATAIVFKTIGYDEQNQMYSGLMAEEIAMLQMSNIQAVGY